jgi:hypothetical protein
MRRNWKTGRKMKARSDKSKETPSMGCSCKINKYYVLYREKDFNLGNGW